MRLWDYVASSDPMSLLTSGGFVSWGCWGLLGIVLVLLYRHGVLAYGAHVKGWESLVLFGIWVIVPRESAEQNFISLGCLLFMVAAVELIITSYALHRTPFLTFNVGLWLGLLVLVHPAYFATVPFIYIQLREIQLSTSRHSSSYILGILCAWWLTFLLMAEPTAEGMTSFLLRHVQGITGVQIPPRHLWIPITILTLLLLFITTRIVSCSGRAVSRYRWGAITHIWLAWIFFILWSIYGAAIHPFFVIALFFTCSAFTFLTGRGESTPFTKLFVFLLSVGAILFTFIHP